MPADRQPRAAKTAATVDQLVAALALRHPGTPFDVQPAAAWHPTTAYWTDGPTPSQAQRTPASVPMVDDRPAAPVRHRKETPELSAAAYLRSLTDTGVHASSAPDAGTLTGNERRTASLAVALLALYPHLAVRPALQHIVAEHHATLTSVLSLAEPGRDFPAPTRDPATSGAPA